MSKQRPDPDKLTNELAGASAFFRRSAPTTPSNANDQAPEPTTSPTTPEPQPDRPDRSGRPGRRFMIRHGFEVYADQLDRLRELSEQKRRQGENGSMSKMVRDAIDRLLDEQQL